MNKEIFNGFDFSLLDSSDFKEDAVREEIIVPILNLLGYSASGINKIIRSKNLEHPFVYIGTRKQNITIIPDYLIQFNNKNFFILDAKSPKEDIEKGKNVEQAFSYAIHRDVRVKYYALCNGKYFILFHVSKLEPIFLGKIVEINIWWPILEKLIGVKNRLINSPEIVFKPDYGIYSIKTNLAIDNQLNKIPHMFYEIPMLSIAKIEEDLYSINSVIVNFDGEESMITFDFNKENYLTLLTTINIETKNIIELALKSQPFRKHFDSVNDCPVSLKCIIGDHVITNNDESYCPFIVECFY